MTDDRALIGRLVMDYAHACKSMMDALNAAATTANLVVAAHRKAAENPLSRGIFAGMAEEKEAQFRPLYQKFEETRRLAKEAGAELIVACGESEPDVELRNHLFAVEPPLLDTVSAAVICMREPFRPPASSFMDALQQANAALASEPYFGQPGFKGFIYRESPTVPAQPGPASVADELAKLADLRDKGVLTDAEFAAHKARLLSS